MRKSISMFYFCLIDEYRQFLRIGKGKEMYRVYLVCGLSELYNGGLYLEL
jgi:hypothetical protein